MFRSFHPSHCKIVQNGKSRKVSSLFFQSIVSKSSLRRVNCWFLLLGNWPLSCWASAAVFPETPWSRCWSLEPSSVEPSGKSFQQIWQRTQSQPVKSLATQPESHFFFEKKRLKAFCFSVLKKIFLQIIKIIAAETENPRHGGTFLLVFQISIDSSHLRDWTHWYADLSPGLTCSPFVLHRLLVHDFEAFWSIWCSMLPFESACSFSSVFYFRLLAMCPAGLQISNYLFEPLLEQILHQDRDISRASSLGSLGVGWREFRHCVRSFSGFLFPVSSVLQDVKIQDDIDLDAVAALAEAAEEEQCVRTEEEHSVHSHETAQSPGDAIVAGHSERSLGTRGDAIASGHSERSLGAKGRFQTFIEKLEDSMLDVSTQRDTRSTRARRSSMYSASSQMSRASRASKVSKASKGSPGQNETQKFETSRRDTISNWERRRALLRFVCFLECFLYFLFWRFRKVLLWEIEWASALVPPTPFLWFEPCDHSHAEQWKNRSTRAPLGLEILGLENVSSGMPKERHPASAWHAMRGKKKKHSHQKTRVRNARFIACAAPAKGRRCALVVAIAKRKLDFPRVRGDERSLAQDFVCCVLRRCVAGGTATSAK